MSLPISITNNQSSKKFLHNFIDKQDNENPYFKRYIFGHNQYSKSIIKEMLKHGILIDGIIDDFSSSNFFDINGYKIPIIKAATLHENATQNLNAKNNEALKCKVVVVVVVVTSQTDKAIAKMKALQDVKEFNNIDVDLDYIDYFAMQRSARGIFDLLELEFFDEFAHQLESNDDRKVSDWSDFRAHFLTHRAEYNKVYNGLSDSVSKSEFSKIINFRLNSDYSFMNGFTFRPDEQYFEDFYGLENMECFFDIGAYQGETSIGFLKRAKNAKKIYFFEPERDNFSKAKATLDEAMVQYGVEVHGFNIGVGDKNERLYITTDSTSSHLNTSCENENSEHIDIDSIDNLIDSGKIAINGGGGGGKCLMIKIDIESAEKLAIKGMANMIAKYRPTLAISSYHRFNDFIEIPKMIFEISKDYKMYFRHYSSGLTESVLFFVAKD